MKTGQTRTTVGADARVRVTGRRSVRGWTILELLVTAIVISILATLSFSAFGLMRAKAADATCTSNMRTLQVALAAYLQDHHHWPQQPIELSSDEEKMWKWWIEELAEYDIQQKYWACPTHVELFMRGRSKSDTPDYVSSYIPTRFDEHESTPYKYPQPWLLERGNFHGGGAKYLMPDGSIRQLPRQATEGRGK